MGGGASGSSCVKVSRGLCRLGDFRWLVAPSPPPVPGPRSVIFWTCPQSSPSLSAARSTASPTPEYSTTAFQVHRGGSNPPSSSPLIPMPGVRLQTVPVRPVCLSVYLTDPSLARTPRSGASYGSSLVCLHHESHRERQSFSYGVDSFIGNDRLTPSPLTCSSDNSPYPSRYSRL